MFNRGHFKELIIDKIKVYTMLIKKGVKGLCD